MGTGDCLTHWMLVALQGRDARASGLHTLASELLTEAGRNMHKRSRRLPMLHHFGVLVQAMGLSTLRHMSRWGVASAGNGPVNAASRI